MTGFITSLPAASTATGLELIEVAQPSDTVTITATTISALASDNSFNDSADGFVAAGFAVGNRVGVLGFTGDTDNNLTVGVITALTTGKMTIGGTDGDVIVDDAAGESVTIFKWETRRSTLAGVAPAPVYSMTIALSDLTTELEAAADVGYWDPPFPIVIDSVSASVFVEPDGSEIEVDILEAGVTILSTALTIDDGETSSATAAVPAVVSDATVSGRLTFDIVAVGSTTGGNGLQVTIVYEAA